MRRNILPVLLLLGILLLGAPFTYAQNTTIKNTTNSPVTNQPVTGNSAIDKIKSIINNYLYNVKHFNLKDSPLVGLYKYLKTSMITKGIVWILVIFVALWVIAIPARIAIETAGRILGFNPPIGNIHAFFLLLAYMLNPFIGFGLFVWTFKDKIGFSKASMLAVISLIIYIILILAIIIGAVYLHIAHI